MEIRRSQEPEHIHGSYEHLLRQSMPDDRILLVEGYEKRFRGYRVHKDGVLVDQGHGSAILLNGIDVLHAGPFTSYQSSPRGGAAVLLPNGTLYMDGERILLDVRWIWPHAEGVIALTTDGRLFLNSSLLAVVNKDVLRTGGIPSGVLYELAEELCIWQTVIGERTIGRSVADLLAWAPCRSGGDLVIWKPPVGMSTCTVNDVVIYRGAFPLWWEVRNDDVLIETRGVVWACPLLGTTPRAITRVDEARPGRWRAHPNGIVLINDDGDLILVVM